MRIQDVAKKANVGVGTVSRVMNGNGYVSDATREKVMKAIEELNYTPNELARNLFHKKTNIIAVIVPDIGYPYYATLVNEIEKVLREYDYKTMLCNTTGGTGNEKSNERDYLDMLERNMVDGVLTATHSLDSVSYNHIDRPMVSFDTPVLSDNIPVITVDHKKGGALAAQAFIDAGCTHVVQFKDKNMDRKYPFFVRHDEFERVIKQAGIRCESYTMGWNQFGHNYMEEAVRDCFHQYSNVDGVFGTDLLALNFMRCAQEAGKSIPKDLKVVAYDGTYIVDMACPTITTVVQPIPQIARAGVEELLKQINGNKSLTNCITLNIDIHYGISTEKS